jgi:hypothetical protein
MLVTKRKEEGMEDDKDGYGASMHGSTLTRLNVLITLWALIWASNFLLYFYLSPKVSISKFPQCLHQTISQTYMISRYIV